MLCDYYPAQDDGAYNHGRLILESAELPQDTRADWQVQLTLLENADGVSQTVEISGSDSVGLATPISLTFRADNVSPVLTVTKALPTASLYQQPISGTVSPTQTATLAGLVSDGGGVRSVIVLITTPSDRQLVDSAWLANGEWAYRLSPSEDGDHTLRVMAVDQAGNTSEPQTYQVNVPSWRAYHLPFLYRQSASGQ
jgi:hypothetical protein